MGVGSEADFLLYFGAGVVLLILTAIVLWVTKRGKGLGQEAEPRRQGQGQADRNPGARRQAAVRRRGRRVADDSDSDDGGGGGGGGGGRAGPAARGPNGDSASDRDPDLEDQLNDPKLGAKKRAKLEAKAEKRAQREAEERLREDRKVKQAKEDAERKVREEQEAAAEKKKEEEEKKRKEEQAQRELEEYNALKQFMTVDDEGCDVIEEEEEENLLQKFLDHIQAHKVVLFEELASKFSLKVPETIDRLKSLVEAGRLTGVMDDRGKFIYISPEELNKFAKFIKQRGRVPISELVENSATLINLVPVVETES